MAGALYITHRNPDLLNLFEEGKEIECYMTIEEAEKKISYYLLYPEKRDRLARAAALKARELYTWEKRIDEALQIVGLEKRRVSQSQSLVSQ
jgi:spore maturation protein CgeB